MLPGTQWQDPSTKQSISQILAEFPQVSRRIQRVSKLDAELLDQELLHILREPLSRALSTVPGGIFHDVDPEITLFLQTILYKLSMWDLGSSYGARLQGLCHITSNNKNSLQLPRKTLLLHWLLTVYIPFLHTRLRSYALSKSWPDLPSSDRRRSLWEIITSLESAYTSVSLISFIAFLWDGRYRSLSDRLLGLKLKAIRPSFTRDVNFEFMNRQMVWHAFTEFLLFILPFVNIRRLPKRVYRMSSHVAASLRPFFWPPSMPLQTSVESNEISSRRGEYHSLPENWCAICAQDAASLSTKALGPLDASSSIPRFPIFVPYVTSCGHIYCYTCVSERILQAADEDGVYWTCLRCSTLVTNVSRKHEDSMDENELEIDGSAGSDVSLASSPH